MILEAWKIWRYVSCFSFLLVKTYFYCYFPHASERASESCWVAHQACCCMWQTWDTTSPRGTFAWSTRVLEDYPCKGRSACFSSFFLFFEVCHRTMLYIDTNNGSLSMWRTEKFILWYLIQTSIMHWFSAVVNIWYPEVCKKPKIKCTFKSAPQRSIGSSHILL